MSVLPEKHEYLESLQERIEEIELLIGRKLEDPRTTESLSDQIIKIKDVVTKALNSLSADIKKGMDEGIGTSLSTFIAASFKKLLNKGDSLPTVVMTAPQKAVLIEKSEKIIEDFAEDVTRVKELESYLTFDPICGMKNERKLDRFARKIRAIEQLRAHEFEAGRPSESA